MTVVGILHPGAMGAQIGRCMVATGTRVLWASNDRTTETAKRATAAGLEDVKDVTTIAEQADIIIAACLPDQAVDVASDVWAAGFKGLYVDANAIPPSSKTRIAELFPQSFVDGGIIGPPPVNKGTTCLYLSGSLASKVAGLFPDASDMKAVTLEGSVTAASALKMTYTAWSTGALALMLNARAMAEGAGVGAAFEAEWERMQPGLKAKRDEQIADLTHHGLASEAEMFGCADMAEAGGLPDGIFRGAADVYKRIESFQGSGTPATLEKALELIRKK